MDHLTQGQKPPENDDSPAVGSRGADQKNARPARQRSPSTQTKGRQADLKKLRNKLKDAKATASDYGQQIASLRKDLADLMFDRELLLDRLPSRERKKASLEHTAPPVEPGSPLYLELKKAVDSFSQVAAKAPTPEAKFIKLKILFEDGVGLIRAGVPTPDVVDAYKFAAIAAGLPELQVDGFLADLFRPLKGTTTARSAVGSTGPSGTPTNYDWRTGCVSAAVLQQKTFPPLSYVIPGLVPEGLSLLTGRPKIGKSWMALDFCLAVAAGHVCMGRQPAPGDVLYAALEDNQRRLQRRVDKVLGMFSKTWPARLTLTNTWRRLDQGGVDDLASWIDGVQAPRLIVIDTLAGVKPVRPTRGYTEDYASLEPLHRLANNKGLAILVLHHTRKLDADDPLDTVSGTLGLTGCADTAIVLSQTGKGPTLYIRGRDIEEAEHATSFDRETCRWMILGEASEVRRSSERNAILDAIGDGEMKVADIVAVTAMKRANVDRLLNAMMTAGEVSRVSPGVYKRPSLEGPNPR